MKPKTIVSLYIGVALVFFVVQFAFTSPFISNGALFTSALLAVSVIQDSRVRALSKKSTSSNILAIGVIVVATFCGCFIYYAEANTTSKLVAGLIFLICAGVHLQIKPKRAHKGFSFKPKKTPTNTSTETQPTKTNSTK